jgi:hypothetical protein
MNTICSTCEAKLACGAKFCAQCGTRTAMPPQISFPCKDVRSAAQADQVDRLKQEDRGFCSYSGVVLAFSLTLLRNRWPPQIFPGSRKSSHSAAWAQGSTIM